MSGYCVSGQHGQCPDRANDTGACSCPCHLFTAEKIATVSGDISELAIHVQALSCGACGDCPECRLLVAEQYAIWDTAPRTPRLTEQTRTVHITFEYTLGEQDIRTIGRAWGTDEPTPEMIRDYAIDALTTELMNREGN